MDATWQGRRSDALYYDTVNVKRRDLCDKIARLEDEEGDLREQLDRYAPKECQYEVVGNVITGGVSWDCMGLRCSRCGHQQLSLDAPNYCPDCGAKVKR